jgi:hypothetical protein
LKRQIFVFFEAAGFMFFYIIMNLIQKKKTVVDLYSFVERKGCAEGLSSKESSFGKMEKGNSSIGLSTLLHFHNNSSMSSVRSVQSRLRMEGKQEDKFSDLMSDARREI